jgi:hypothetical protein
VKGLGENALNTTECGRTLLLVGGTRLRAGHEGGDGGDRSNNAKTAPIFLRGGVWSSSFRGATTYLDRGLTTCPTLYNRHKTFKVNNCECCTHFTDLLNIFDICVPPNTAV